MQGQQFVWGLIVLGQLYQDLYTFINVDKGNVTIAHANLLQIYKFNHIVMIQLVGL